MPATPYQGAPWGLAKAPHPVIQPLLRQREDTERSKHLWHVSCSCRSVGKAEASRCFSTFSKWMGTLSQWRRPVQFLKSCSAECLVA